MGELPEHRRQGVRARVSPAAAALHVAALLFVVASTAAGQEPRNSVSGRIADSSGVAVAGAEVALGGSTLRALSDQHGAYRLRGVPAGRRQLTVRRLGFRVAAREIEVAPSGETRADVLLAPVPHRLAAVQVRERREVYDARLAGFNERVAKRKSGYFVTRDRIDRAHSHRLMDLLREIPGVRIRPTRAWGTVVQLRGANCPPLVFVDGFPASAAPLDLDVIDLASVEGIEIYSSMASAPSEFISARALDRCGVIAVWSRPARPPMRAARSSVPVDLARLLDGREVFTADQVDVAAHLEEGTARAAYPDSLWRAQVPGRVLVEFVVDTSGAVEPMTLGIVSSTHADFSEAARLAVAGARFAAAHLNRRPVRQLVQLPFIFEPGDRR